MLYFTNQNYLNHLKNKGFKRVKTISEWLKNPENTYYLKYDGRTYGYKFNDELRLFSYSTLVCTFNLKTMVLIINDWYSVTTQKHQFDFIDNLVEFYDWTFQRTSYCEILGNTVTKLPKYHKIYDDENLKSGKGFLELINAIDFKNDKYHTNKDKYLGRLENPEIFIEKWWVI